MNPHHTVLSVRTEHPEPLMTFRNPASLYSIGTGWVWGEPEANEPAKSVEGTPQKKSRQVVLNTDTPLEKNNSSLKARFVQHTAQQDCAAPNYKCLTALHPEPSSGCAYRGSQHKTSLGIKGQVCCAANT